MTPKPLHPLYGHEAARRRLATAILSGRLPQSLLLEGPQGVGKQRMALWIAQALLCEREAGDGGRGSPCETCRSCHFAATLSHPDLHWFFPIEPPKKGGDADKQMEVIAEALAEETALRRERPLYGPASGLASHGIASVRLLLRRLALTPAMGRYKVFVIGDADRLIPQPGAEQAANALLKALEEPPHDTQFVLTTSDPDALLGTILSRVVRVRVLRLPASVMTSFVQNEMPELASGARSKALAAADGSPGRLIAQQGGARRRGGSGGGAEAFVGAARSSPAAAYAFALSQMPFQARGAFSDMLDDLLERLREELRDGADTDRLVQAIAQVFDARAQAQSNVNPQLLAAVLAEDIGGPGGSGGSR
jgi:DNA polymerase-3 subunit delta'